ncbi:MAG TPA: efflux RND transporter periplasmic adaptor subunit [Steroidobacteraceae bacterium]|nr:efflux RND transporter periplasmic adaptor subunit [Steroidobacteraceae bacterium]
MLKPKRALWIGVGLLAIVGIIVFRMIVGRGALPEGLIQANGRIEGDHLAVSSKFAGRIAEIKVREGDSVKTGQVLAVLDDAQIKTKVTQATAAVAALNAQVDAVTTALALLRKEVPLAVGGADAALSRANADIAKAKASHDQASREAERTKELLAQGVIPKQGAERADLAVTSAEAEHEATRGSAIQAGKQLSQARLGADRIKAKESELAALQAQLEQAKARLAETESVLEDLTLKAPSPGVVMTRIREVGEVINAGSPILDLVDLDRLYLKVYVPEIQIGKLRLNLPARIYIDAYPETPFDATVSYISSRAEFTPKEVQTPDERVKLTYAVKLTLTKNPDRKLTPGLPADAVVRWKDGVEWVKPKW